MRILLFTSVAYVAGIEGFGFFLPYLAFMGVVIVTARYMNRRSRAAVAIPVSAPRALELEPAIA
jgi:hypothetical protein